MALGLESFLLLFHHANFQRPQGCNRRKVKKKLPEDLTFPDFPVERPCLVKSSLYCEPNVPPVINKILSVGDFSYIPGNKYLLKH